MDLSNHTNERNELNRSRDSWDRKASIRTISRRVLQYSSGQTYFPKHEQPICSHPLIVALGSSVKQYILTQTAYKFMLGISEHETRVVTSAVQKLLCGDVPLSDDLRQNLQTVVIDESYHSMVAYDFIEQVQSVTGQKTLPFPKDSDLGLALEQALKKIPSNVQDNFTFIAVCIAENLITQELLARQTDPAVNPFFYEINHDHLVDEGRHAKIFTEVVGLVWARMTVSERESILQALPPFIKKWMKREISIEGDRKILHSLPLTPEEVETVIYDTHPELDFKTASDVNPNIKHIQNWLRRVGIWQDEKNLWSSSAHFCQKSERSNSLCSLVSEHANDHPEQIALCSKSLRITYKELDQRVSALGNKLKLGGFTPGSRIGILVSDRLNYVCTLLGVMKAGLTAVPLTLDQQTSYFKDVLDIAEVKLILCDGSESAKVEELTSIPFWICETSLFEGTTLEEDYSNPDKAACVLFTSGTTGTPKGVLLSHSAIIEFALGAKQAFPLQSNDVILHFSNLSFDASLAEIANAIAAGAALALPSETLMDSPSHFFQQCEDLNITVLNLPAAFWAQLSNQTQSQSLVPQSLRLVLIYGESINLTALETWYQKKHPAVLVNTYGPTETTIGASFCHLDSHPTLRKERQPIGTPFPGKEIYVLDESQRTVSPGTIGEIYIGGSGVESYYLESGNKTPVPVYQTHPKFGHIYRTGDYGRWDHCPDSNTHVLIFCGRRDRQVKISGSRVEPTQIEKVLTNQKGVSEAIVVVHQRENVSTLSAFVLRETGYELSESSLMAHIKKSLPNYSCPSRITVLDNWPLTPRGKIDRSALESQCYQVGPDGTDFKDELANIWQRLLLTSEITESSHFFKLGGNSLLAMTLVGKVNERWQVGLSLRQVIEAPTFAQMSYWLKDSLSHNKVVYSTRESPEKRHSGSLSYAQEALLLIDRMQADNSIQYNVAFAVSIEKNVDFQALNLAINQAIHGQESLRTIFEWKDGRTIQRVVPLSITLKEEKNSYEDFLQTAEMDARTAFQLSQAPPISVRYFAITDRPERILYFKLHHIIHDGISIHVLVDDIFQAYRNVCHQKQKPIADRRVNYLDFAVGVRKKINANQTELLEFWANYLKGTHPLTLPIRKKGLGNPINGNAHTIPLGKTLLTRLRQKCFDERVSLFAALFSAAEIAFRQGIAVGDFTVGSIMSLRESPAYMGLTGMFVNTVLIKASSNLKLPIKQMVHNSHHSILDVMPFRHTPLALLIDQLNLARESGENKVFDIMVNYHPFTNLFAPDNTGLTQKRIQFIDNKTTTAGLVIDFYDWGEELQIRLAYCKDLYGTKDIISLGETLLTQLRRLAENDWT